MTNKSKSENSHKIEVLYQDQWIIVINKAPGILSVPFAGSSQRTAQSMLEEILRKQGIANSKHKPFAVHRLDRDTSGVMMFALSEQAQQKIMNSWQTMVTERLYRCVSQITKKADLSILKNKQGTISDSLAKNAYHVGFVPKIGDKDKNGRDFKTVFARTNYKVLLEGKTHVLFELSLDTGKKNQIRAHLAGHGFPLVGDDSHTKNLNEETPNPFGRLCLHARTLEFVHPFTDKKMKFEVPEPEEWEKYVQKGDFSLKKSEFQHKNQENHKNFKKEMHGSQNKNQENPKNHKNHKERNFKKTEKNDFNFSELRPSKKQLAHMDFIQRGKYEKK